LEGPRGREERIGVGHNVVRAAASVPSYT